MTDFLLAGRRLGVPLCAAAMAATHFGGGAVVGGASYGFEHGLSGAWYGIATGVGLLLLVLLTASRFRSFALYTVPDFLEQRFGSRSLRVLGATLSLIALVGILAAQVGAARAAFAVTGLDPTVAAIIAAIGSAIAMVGITTEMDIAGAPVEVIAALISAAVFVVVSVVGPQSERN